MPASQSTPMATSWEPLKWAGAKAVTALAVYEIAKGSTTITTLASFNGTNGQFPVAGITLDSAGDLLGTTEFGGSSGDGTVFEIAKGSTTITTLASFDVSNGAQPQAGIPSIPTAISWEPRTSAAASSATCSRSPRGVRRSPLSPLLPASPMEPILRPESRSIPVATSWELHLQRRR